VPQSAAPSRRLVFDGALALSIQGAAAVPLAFTIQDVANGLMAGGGAVTCPVAGRPRGVFVAAWPIAQRKRKKSLSCVTTRRRKLGVLNGLGRGLQSLTARFLGLGTLGLDVGVLAAFRLPPGCEPTAQFTQAFRVLTVTLVMTTRLVFARASFAQTIPLTRPARSSPSVTFSRTLASAHGSFALPRESSGRMCNRSPRALSKLE
jgi:hypothetical protein